MINNLLLPVIIVFILLLVNDRRIMGDFVNNRLYNVVCWTSAALLTAVSVTYVVSMFFPS